MDISMAIGLLCLGASIGGLVVAAWRSPTGTAAYHDDTEHGVGPTL